MNSKITAIALLLMACTLIGYFLGATEIGIGVGFIVGLALYYKVFDDQ